MATLDGRSRTAGFLFALRDSGVDFFCCDMPDVNTLTVGLFAVLAQYGRETISKRARDALAARKARGATLGSPADLTDAAWQQCMLVRRAERSDTRAGGKRSLSSTRTGRREYAFGK